MDTPYNIPKVPVLLSSDIAFLPISITIHHIVQALEGGVLVQVAELGTQGGFDFGGIGV